MMAGQPRPTLADYAVIAISPALIMTLVGSLVFFLVEVFYQGGHGSRLSFILALFVLAAVCVARISIEQGRGYAATFALPLGVVVVIAMLRFVQFQGPLAPFSSLVNIGLVGLIWWCADKLTWDCTVIDEQQDMSGQGLMQTLAWENTHVEGGARATGTQVEVEGRVGADANVGGASGGFWQRFDHGRRRPHAPGVWVIYFSLAALPIFGIGQGFLSQSDLASRRYVFQLLMVYLASALGLLLTSSFLALRRYLRQRNMEMPGEIARVWFGSGVIMIVALLLFCTLLPRRNPEYSVAQLSWFARTPDHLPSSRWAWGKDGVPSDRATSASTELASAQSAPRGEARAQADPTRSSPATSATRPQGPGAQSNGAQSNGASGSASSPVQQSAASGTRSQGNVAEGSSSQGSRSQGDHPGSPGAPDSGPSAASRAETTGSLTGGESRLAGSNAEGPTSTRSGTQSSGARDNMTSGSRPPTNPASRPLSSPPPAAADQGRNASSTSPASSPVENRSASGERPASPPARTANESQATPGPPSREGARNDASRSDSAQQTGQRTNEMRDSSAARSQPSADRDPNRSESSPSGNAQSPSSQSPSSPSNNASSRETPPQSAPKSGDAGEKRTEPVRRQPDSQPASTDASAARESANNDTQRSARDADEPSAERFAEPPAEPSSESSAEPSADAKQDREGSNASSQTNESAGKAERSWDLSSWTNQIGPLLGGFFQAMYWLLAAATLAFLAWRNWATLRQACGQFLESLRAWLAWLRGESVPDGTEPAAGAAAAVGRPFRDFRDPFRTGDAQRMSPDQLVSYSFQALEAFCREQGRPRSPDETPLEFAQAVGRQIQRLAQPAVDLAELYNWSAYSGGGLPASARPRLQHFWRCLLTLPPSVAEET